jgi:HlyD family secretion protein
MRHRIVFALAALGLLAGLAAAWYFARQRPAQPPAFAPVSSPYASALYASGIIESDQAGGSNVSVYPEVTGTVARVLVREGQRVTAGTPLMILDDAVQAATTEQYRLQSEASRAALEALRAQPRPEELEIARAQVDLATASLKTARDQYDKRQASWDADPYSISRDALDTARDTARQAEKALDVAVRQFALVRAGAWGPDIASQRRQAEAQRQAWLAAQALLGKYTVRARSDGVVMAVNVAAGSLVSAQGAWDPYTQAFAPALLLGAAQDHLAVRCYVDEILVSRLPAAGHIRAQMSIRGTDAKVALEFVRIQPYVSPKLALSNQRAEKVDLRVLPVIFRFVPPAGVATYPGQLVDVFIGPT